MPRFPDSSVLLYAVSRQTTIEWTEKLEQTFEGLKRRLLERPIVRLPDVQRDFILERDASTVAVGAVLKQQFNGTQLEHPVAFFSRALTQSEQNYYAYELEMYAVVRAVEHYRFYLLGREFPLRTDHMALVRLLQRDLPPTTRVEIRILRLFEYQFRIEHQKGKANVLADVLSRLPLARACEAESKSISALISVPENN